MHKLCRLEKGSTQAIYCVKGVTNIKLSKDKDINLREGDIALLILKENIIEAKYEVKGQGKHQSEIIIATVC